MKKMFIIGLLLLLCTILACEKQEADPVVEEPVVEKVIEKVEAVCIWDKGSLRKEPNRKAKWISNLALGEKMIWTGEAFIDSTDKNRRFLKMLLSDGTEGWTADYFVVTNAKPAVLVKDASIYSRPDLVTETDKDFKEMEIVAVESAQDDWLKVVGEKKEKKGWIQSKSVSVSDVNVAVALLSAKAMGEKEVEDKIEKLEAIINNSSFSSSIFIQKLSDQLNDLKSPQETSTEPDSAQSQQ
jgi:hypothetical protein